VVADVSEFHKTILNTQAIPLQAIQKAYPASPQ